MIKTDVKVNIDYTSECIKDALVRSLPVSKSELREVVILKKTLKISDGKPFYLLSVGASLSPEREAGLLKMKKKVSECPNYDFCVAERKFSTSPVVVGAGPAGLFCALTLAMAGAMPVILERGLPVDERDGSVKRFITERVLDTECNVQFGEGGAGAFSDGKLKVGSMDKYKHFVLSELVSAGAPQDILYTVGAHLGTDKLPHLVKAVREKIKALGGKFIYSARLSDIIIKEEKLVGIRYDEGGKEHTLDTDICILATGHSARDTFLMLYSHGIKMESRGFGIGVRAEHPREYINSLCYNDCTLADRVGTASYHLVTHLAGGRSVYSFCMCPGGTVVPAASEHCGIVTNGMSEYSRMAQNSNAALLVSVTPQDFGSAHPLAGIQLQRRIENTAFLLAGSDYSAPAITMERFMSASAAGEVGCVCPSYPLGTAPIEPEKYLGNELADALRAGISDFDNWMSGFYYPDAVLTGAETRSTSPVRVLRNEKFMCPTVRGLYPIGEGAGYAGGIVSAATDGVRAAESILIYK